MTEKKDPKRQLLGKIAKARGKQFESRIDDSFAYYVITFIQTKIKTILHTIRFFDC